MPLLRIDNASLHYDNLALLDGVSLTIQNGDKIGLLGRILHKAWVVLGHDRVQSGAFRAMPALGRWSSERGRCVHCS